MHSVAEPPDLERLDRVEIVQNNYPEKIEDNSEDEDDDEEEDLHIEMEEETR